MVTAVQALAEGIPWWAYTLIVLSCPAVYIYRLRGVFQLAAKALDKAEHDQVVAIMATVTGHPPAPTPSASVSSEEEPRSDCPPRVAASFVLVPLSDRVVSSDTFQRDQPV